jgi:hypothetical protein
MRYDQVVFGRNDHQAYGADPSLDAVLFGRFDSYMF